MSSMSMSLAKGIVKRDMREMSSGLAALKKRPPRFKKSNKVTREGIVRARLKEFNCMHIKIPDGICLIDTKAKNVFLSKIFENKKQCFHSKYLDRILKESEKYSFFILLEPVANRRFEFVLIGISATNTIMLGSKIFVSFHVLARIIYRLSLETLEDALIELVCDSIAPLLMMILLSHEKIDKLATKSGIAMLKKMDNDEGIIISTWITNQQARDEQQEDSNINSFVKKFGVTKPASMSPEL